MNAKHILRVFGVLFALCSGLALGWSVSVWADALGRSLDGYQEAHAAQDAPRVTSTPVWPDYAAQLTWDGRWTCPDPVLALSAVTVQYAYCYQHVSFGFHLVNNNGATRDFGTGVTHGYATIICQLGREIPFDWLQAMPFTLTISPSIVDGNPSNNVTVLNSPPPNPGLCLTPTPVTTPTSLPIYTATSTCTVTPSPTASPAANLTGSMGWGGTSCPAPVLTLRTNYQGDSCYSGVGPSTMRLSNSGGEHIDFRVSGLSGPGGFDELYCQVGPCMPMSWLDSLPFTLTVDVFNEVQELIGGGEGDNVSSLPAQPPPCGTSTPTYTPTATLTATRTPVCCANVTGGTSSAMCIPTFGYYYSHSVNNNCTTTTTGTFTEYLEVSPNQGGPWTPFTNTQAFTRTLQTGSDSIDGNMGLFNIPPPYNWFRMRLAGTALDNCWTLEMIGGPSAVCREATPVITPTSVRTFTPTPTPPPGGSPTVTETPCPMSFSDVNPGDYFYEAVRYLYCHGAISGYGDGTFRPYNNVNRGQVCKIVVVAFDVPIDTHGGPHFSDVPQDHPFYQWIESAYNSDIITGYDDGTFRPYNNVTRGQLTKIICRVIGLPPIDPPVPTFSDVSRDSPFYGYVEAAYCAGVINGYSDGTFRPYNNVTRGQTSVIVYRALQGVNYCGTPTPEAIRY